MNKPVRILVKEIKIIKFYDYIQPFSKNKTINIKSISDIKKNKNINNKDINNKNTDKNFDEDFLYQIMINGGL